MAMPPRKHTKHPEKGKVTLSTQGLTKRLTLVDIPEISSDDQTCWKVKAIATIDAEGNISSKVLETMLQWKQSNREDWDRIIKSLRYVSGNKRHENKSKVINDRRKQGVFEIRANRCVCRLISFYDTTREAVVICAFPYSKGKGHHERDQDAAFAKCATIKTAYFQQKP